MYTPFKYEDVPKEGVPRVTEEEFSELKEAHFAKRRAENDLRKIEARILAKYGKLKYEDIDKDGLPRYFWCIQGHNIEKGSVIY